MADYFVWKGDKKLVGKYAHFDQEPETFELSDWISGVPMKKRKKMTLVTNEKYETKLTDNLLTSYELPVFSDKLAKVLEGIGVKNVEYHKVDVVDHETEEVTENYSAANVLGHIACLDEENSTLRRSRRSNSVVSLRQFKLVPSKIKPTPHMHNKALMFRLAEFPYIIIVDESVKKAVEDSGMTGVNFVAPDVFIG